MNKRDAVGQCCSDAHGLDADHVPAPSKSRSGQPIVDSQKMSARPVPSRREANLPNADSQMTRDRPSPPKTDLDEPAKSRMTPTGHVPAQSNPTVDEGGQKENDSQRSGAAPSASNGGDGHFSRDTQSRGAESATHNADVGQSGRDHHAGIADVSPLSEISGQANRDAQERDAADLDLICDRLKELHRQRQDLHRAEKSMTLRIKAKCRRIVGGDDPKKNKKEGDKLYKSMFKECDHKDAVGALLVSEPFIRARALLNDERKKTETFMECQAKLLPVAEWISGIRGCGYLGLGLLVGEPGNLSKYSGVAKLRQRMGIGGLPNGEIQRKKKGDEGIAHGYNPSRRAVLWTIGTALQISQSQHVDKKTGEVLREAGPYRLIYDKEKAKQLPRCEAMIDVMKKKSKSGKYSYKKHAHNMAKRYMEKEFLKDLWRAWRDAVE